MTSALAEPVDRVGRGWTAGLSLANVAVWVGWYGPMQILLAQQAEDFAPGTGMSKETLLAWVTGAGAVGSLVANPVFGALSDRTTARRGRRTVGVPPLERSREWGRIVAARRAARCRCCCSPGRAGCGRWRSAGVWSS